MQSVLDMIEDEEEDLMGGMGFILTVLRDNTADSDTFQVLDKIVKRMWREQIGK
jgi:hypothetical protein